MDSTEQFDAGFNKSTEQPSYWTSISIASVLFGIFTFVISLITTYTMINAEPSGAILSTSRVVGMLGWLFGCLVGAMGGLLAVWHFAKEYDVPVKLGKGALIGFLTGIGMAVVTVILGQTWHLFDPDMTQKLIDSTIANLEAMDMPADQKQQIIDSTAQSIRGNQGIGSQLMWGIPLYGILNLLTGMIGAKVFGKEEEEF